MDKITYNKLVRDKIPKIIEKSGKKAVIYIADDKEYLEKLYEKLLEEIGEFKENPSPEELADILEVCDAIREYFKIDNKEVESIKKKKYEERGGFYKKIILKEVIVGRMMKNDYQRVVYAKYSELKREH